ncbi:hypothetical protein [Massilia sp. BSC265]|uniref:hypothetical protein n=1 Tax=Massilia sp. BSC265 TaxID=1549812 RepID=UPI000AA96F71|nr:hypothetical protein [Massilia sp. BSC265]
MHISQHPTHTLELRVRELPQLFNSLDPTPFLNKDLDRNCEAYIENWALQLPRDSHLNLTIHVEDIESPELASELVADALHNFYAYKVELVRGELRQLLRQGRTSLGIGIGFLASCLMLAELIGTLVTGHPAKIMRETLTVIGWVALWRPAQTFLYDWWPVRSRIRVFENLRFARVTVRRGLPELVPHPGIERAAGAAAS